MPETILSNLSDDLVISLRNYSVRMSDEDSGLAFRSPHFKGKGRS